jgi:hypothetical protein
MIEKNRRQKKPRIHLANDARGSRASTGPGLSWNLLDNPKGLSMAKTAPDMFRHEAKFVPLVDSLQKQQTTQGRACKPMIRRLYTLCEVDNAERQSVPVLC